jgi:hypothetical protein
MSTGKKPASKAGKELRDPKSTYDEKTVAASDLSQAKSGKSKNLARNRDKTAYRATADR